MTPQGKVKLLDFGLAKALAPEASADDPGKTTGTYSGTRDGIILGTPPYMSPEQARGKPLDKRTDIWSFGCVLYEALSGKKAFPGETGADVIAAVLEREPDWRALPASTPFRLRDLVKRCLRKDFSRRLRDIRDVRLEIEDIGAEQSQTPPWMETNTEELPARAFSGPGLISKSTSTTPNFPQIEIFKEPGSGIVQR